MAKEKVTNAADYKADRERKQADLRLKQITDQVVVDAKGKLKPAPPSPSIFDV